MQMQLGTDNNQMVQGTGPDREPKLALDNYSDHWSDDGDLGMLGDKNKKDDA